MNRPTRSGSLFTMTHAMNLGEDLALPGRATSFVRRLQVVADRGPASSALVRALLDSIVERAERSTPSGALPAAERDLWVSVGAPLHVALGRPDTKAVEAFADLLTRSVAGDATMAKLLRKDRSRISQRVAERSIYAFVAGDERFFPLWQIVDGAVPPSFRPVFESLDPKLHPLSVDHWFISPNVDLQVGNEPTSPAAWLATGGNPAEAAALAADV